MSDARWNPTRVGHECAAFVRYRASVGLSDLENQIEPFPSSQWGDWWIPDEDPTPSAVDPLGNQMTSVQLSNHRAWRKQQGYPE